MRGVATAPGICLGRVVFGTEPGPVMRRPISDPDHEIQRLNEAIEKARIHVAESIEKARAEIGEEGVSVFGAQQMLLEDPDLYARVEEQVRKDRVNVEWVLDKIVGGFVAIFETMEDPVLKARATDLKDIGSYLLLLLQGQEPFSERKESVPSVLVAHDLIPGEMIHTRQRRILGVITEIGGPTSHAAILARALEIPMIVGAGPMMEGISEGDLIALDGHTGEYYINPDEATVAQFTYRMECEQQTRARLRSFVGKETATVDGFPVRLTCNIASVEDLDAVKKYDGESVGLFRTEYLFMDRESAPTEEEQFQVYYQIVEAFPTKPVTIRTLDIGGDKRLPYLPMHEEANPVLGFRSLRYCLEDTELFMTQLKALVRASAFGRLQILLPMVTTIDELRRAKAMIQEAKRLVEASGHAVGDFKVGTMIEVPSAALIADHLAKESDFFSIGTNDLFQYTLSADRMNPLLTKMLTPYQPSVLRLIRMAAESARAAGIPVSMCGEAASEPKLVPLWLGIGIRELSMHPAQILPIRDLISRQRQAGLIKTMNQALQLESAEMVKAFLRGIQCLGLPDGSCCIDD